MSRRRFVQDSRTGELIEVGLDFVPTRSTQGSDGLLWNDRSYDGMQSTDGADISSRSKHRQYMKERGLTTADDFKQTWERSREAREGYFKGERGRMSVTGRDVAQAIEQLRRR